MGAAGADTKPTPVIPIFAALGAGALVGWLIHPDGMLGGFNLLPVFDVVGTMFINLLKMLIVPLIMASVITGVAALGTGPDLGRLGLKTVTFYVVTTLVAVLIALMLVNVVAPGVDGEGPVRNKLALQADAAQVTADVRSHASTGSLDAIRGVVPSNIVEAAANTKLLGLILFSVLFGFYLARIPQPQQGTVFGFWQGIFQIMMRMTSFVMLLAPIGVFALIAKVIATAGFAAVKPLVLFALCVLGGLFIFAVIALPVLLTLVARVNPWRLYPAMAPALLTAFSTASSSATLPLSLQCLERRANVSERIAGFVMPLGASMNHAGSALYECAAAMFICQAYGLHLSFGTQFTVVILCAGHVHGHGGHSVRIPCRHRGHPRGCRTAARSHRCAAGVRPRARHVPYRGQRARRCRLHRHRGASRRRDRRAGGCAAGKPANSRVVRPPRQLCRFAGRHRL
jgi:Na+/H+-dicarboxylate symporter